MNDSWRIYAKYFDALSDAEIAREVEKCRTRIEEDESLLEAVSLWEAAGKPRNSMKISSE